MLAGGAKDVPTHKQRIFLEEYLQCWNASEAARRAGYSLKTCGAIGHKLLKKVEIADEIRRRVTDATTSTNEGLILLSTHAHANIGEFFKVHERWTEAPRPTDEILEEKLVQDEKGQPLRVYLVRCLVLDLEKLTDPRFGALVKKFGDSPRAGLSIELHDAQAAIVKLLEAQGMFKPTATASLNIDMSKLSDAQLERIAAGEDPLKVLISGSDGNGQRAGAS